MIYSFIISLICFSIVYAISDAFHDAYMRRNKTWWWHTIDAFIKCTVAWYIWTTAFYFSQSSYYFESYWSGWWIPYIILVIRWDVFDPVYNRLTGKKWYYTEVRKGSLNGTLSESVWPLKIISTIFMILIIRMLLT